MGSRTSSCSSLRLTTDHMGGPDMAPRTPQRSERPGFPGALLEGGVGAPSKLAAFT